MDEKQKREGRNLAGLGFVGFGLLLCKAQSHLGSVWDGVIGVIVMFFFIVGIALVFYPKKGFYSSFVKLGRRRRGLSWPTLAKR